MRVKSGACSLTMPPFCACCVAPAQDTFRVSFGKQSGVVERTTTITAWEFPVCRACKKHIDARRKISEAGCGVALFGCFGVGFLVKDLEGFMPHAITAAFLVVVLGLVVAMRFAMGGNTSRCKVGYYDPVELKVDSLSGCIFTFCNDEFGRRFLEANPTAKRV